VGAGAVLHLSLSDEIAVGELPGAAVAVAAAVVGVENDVPRVGEGLAQGVPLVGMVPCGTAVDDHHRSTIGALGLTQQPGYVGEAVEAAVAHVTSRDERMAGQLRGERVREPGDTPVRDIDTVEVAGLPGAAVDDQQRVAGGSERRPVAVSWADVERAQRTCGDVSISGEVSAS
jgi:hypothetical protein